MILRPVLKGCRATAGFIENMRSRAGVDGTFSDKVERMAEDFDLDGIMKLAEELEKKTDV